MSACAIIWSCLLYTSMLASTKPVISVGAVRTGSGKSQTSRRVLSILQNDLGYERVVAVRHPMPYGNLAEQAVQLSLIHI